VLVLEMESERAEREVDRAVRLAMGRGWWVDCWALASKSPSMSASSSLHFGGSWWA